MKEVRGRDREQPKVMPFEKVCNLKLPLISG